MRPSSQLCWFLCLALLCLAGCSPGARSDRSLPDPSTPHEDGPDAGTSRPDASTPHEDGPDAGTSRPDAGTTHEDGPDAGTSTPAHQYCQPSCQKAADCVEGSETKGAFDDDNYTCTNGLCVYAGCRSNAECDATYTVSPPGTYRCAAQGAGLKYCLLPCQTAADCADGSETKDAYGDDNYACRDGFCAYTGCRSDAECDATYASLPAGSFRCRPYLGISTSFCQLACRTPSECVAPGTPTGGAYDADNYTCTDGVCAYTGCRTDGECDATFSTQQPGAYVCR